MELKTKNQYSYFIYPFVIDEKKYDKYLLKLLKDKNCKLKLWEKEDNLNLYTYFTSEVREYLFWPFSFSDDKKEKLEELDDELESKILCQNECTMFEYILEPDVQGKLGENNGMFFNIKTLEIVCFKTGICFIVLKTTLGDENEIVDVLDFNNKVRNVNPLFVSTKENEKIRIQTNSLRDIKELSTIIKDIIGTNHDTKEAKIEKERILTYSYIGIDKEDWNQNEQLGEYFTKLYSILPNDCKIDSSEGKQSEKDNICEISKFAKIGATKQGSVLISSNEDKENYINLSCLYEKEYLYTYILTVYKKIFLNNINVEFKKTANFEKTKAKLLEFTEKIWIQKITNNKEAYKLQKKWEEILELNNIYEQLKMNMKSFIK